MAPGKADWHFEAETVLLLLFFLIFKMFCSTQTRKNEEGRLFWLAEILRKFRIYFVSKILQYFQRL